MGLVGTVYSLACTLGFYWSSLGLPFFSFAPTAIACYKATECYHPSTKVTLPNHLSVPVSELTNGTDVLTLNSNQTDFKRTEVKNVRVLEGDFEFIQFDFDDPTIESLIVTPEHFVSLNGKKLYQASDAKIGDTMTVGIEAKHEIKDVEISSIKSVNSTRKYQILTDEGSILTSDVYSLTLLSEKYEAMVGQSVTSVLKKFQVEFELMVNEITRFISKFGDNPDMISNYDVLKLLGRIAQIYEEPIDEFVDEI